MVHAFLSPGGVYPYRVDVASVIGHDEVDAIVIAAAGLDRLAKGGRIDERIDMNVIPPAPAQGALAVQACNQDGPLLEELRLYDHADVRLAVEAERRVLYATGGSCRAPVGALRRFRLPSDPG